VGLPSKDTGKDHMRRLKGMLEAAMDVYTFMVTLARQHRNVAADAQWKE